MKNTAHKYQLFNIYNVKPGKWVTQMLNTPAKIQAHAMLVDDREAERQ